MRTYLYLFLLILVTVPFTVHGQTSNNTFVPLQPGLPGIKEFAQSNSIPELLNNIYKICIGVAATLAVLQIMRAGVLYMGGDSVTEKKDAKDLISASIIGLILVLSPVIVFSIINPEILSLKIGAGNLRNASQPTSGAAGTSGGGASGGTPQTQAQCAQQYPGANLKSVSNPNALACSALPGAGAGWKDAPGCCSNLPAGSTCCGKPAASTPAPAPTPTPAPAATVDYMWRMLMEKQNGTGRAVQSAGPFKTQKACQDSMAKFMSDNGLVQSDAVPQCDCSAPRSTFPQCKNG